MALENLDRRAMPFRALLETFLHLEPTAEERRVQPWGPEIGPHLYIDIYKNFALVSRALNSLIWMLKRVAHVGGWCAAVLGPRPPLLVIHFSTRVRVVIRSTLNISLNVWTQVFHVY